MDLKLTSGHSVFSSMSCCMARHRILSARRSESWKRRLWCRLIGPSWSHSYRMILRRSYWDVWKSMRVREYLLSSLVICPILNEEDLSVLISLLPSWLFRWECHLKVNLGLFWKTKAASSRSCGHRIILESSKESRELGLRMNCRIRSIDSYQNTIRRKWRKRR